MLPNGAMEQLSIRDSFELRTSDDARLWLQTLEEHDIVLRRLTDSHSDEFALLKQYRLTVQIQRQESIAEFVEFLSGEPTAVRRAAIAEAAFEAAPSVRLR